MQYFSRVPIYDDIGISTGAYANFSLAAALLRIGEIAPSAEILSVGRHSLLDEPTCASSSSQDCPSRCTGRSCTSSTAAARRGGTGRRSRCTAVTSPLPPSSAPASTSCTPTCSASSKGWDTRVVKTLESSFEELAALQEEYGVVIAVENLPFVRHTHFRAPGDLDLHGLGLALDVGHAAVTGTLEAWLGDGAYDLKLVHLHDNEGYVGGDQHLPLGRGIIDAAPVMELARAAGARSCSSTRTRPT